NEVERFSKVAGLSETGLNTIKYDPVSKKMLVAYTNSNIDLIDEKGIHNIPDLKRENSSGDKTIYHIFPDGNRWYLSTGLGIVVLDGDKFEIKDSWLIGSRGNFIKTNAFTKINNFFYAATDEGLKKISTTNNNPADFSNWQNLSGINGLSSSACKSVVNFSGKAIALQNDSLFVENGNSWNLFFANGWPVLSINVSENKLFVCQRQQNGKSQVLVLGTDGSVHRTIQQNGVTDFPQKAISFNNTIWIADLYDGLSKWTSNHYEIYKPNSPEDVATGRMTVYNNVVYVSAGSVNDAWNYQYNRAGVFKLAGGNWTNYNQFNFPLLDTLMDFITVAVDPRDESVWAGSYGGGLLHIKKDGKLEIFKQNSPIKETVGDPGSYRVSGLAFDANNNLWISNFGSNLQLHVLKKDGSWKSFSAPFPLSENAAAEILIDDANQKWIVSPKGNGLIVFNDNNTIDNTSDDKWKTYKQGNGLGNLPSNEVFSITKDKSGFVWVGTSNGIGVIQCPQDAVTRGCDAIWPVINEGSFANYLFKGQDVRSIAV
ncbi:MAG TPA: two-component regulator propeller domain-containing protein, partial [Flavisolibacter sp.]|nr:two-component regulator propeller domain-containing protein [Flavisolibacter sp.]